MRIQHRFPPLPICFLALTALAIPCVFAQNELKDIPDPDVEAERAALQLAPGFEINLFASDPVIAKPIQMNFDPEGRLWVVSSTTYPQIKPGETADDKIIVLEDRDGNGVAEKSTLFAEGLLIPTGVAPGDGGAYIANSTELIFLRDSDGDGRADQKRVVLSGFGTEDTHHIIHTLRWGNDGMLYFNQSIYIHSHIETPYGPRRLGGGGIWQFRPETMRLEVFIRGFVNPWGHGFDRWGQSFATDGAYIEGINYIFPGAIFFSAPGSKRVLTGLNPGSPKHCGLEVLSGSHLPDEWRGNMLTNDFRGHRVCRFVISEDGSGYASREQPELIKTSHVGFRPIDIKMGPDGAIYIADWYNPIIQHGEVDFRDPRRDHVHGRIWRVTATGRPLVPRPKLVGASVEELLAALKAPEDWTRKNAKRVLKEQGAEKVRPALEAWVKQLDATDPDFEHQRLEALWTYQSLDVPEMELLKAVLHSPDPHARAAAVRIIPFWLPKAGAKSGMEPLDLLAERVGDENPRVRLEAVRAFAAYPSLRAAQLALTALDRPMDRWLDFGVWLTARDLQTQWLPPVQAGEFDFGGNFRQLTFALQSVGSPSVVQPLVLLLEKGKIPEQKEQSVLELIASLGGPKEMEMILDQVVKGDAASARRRARLLDALNRATRERRVKPDGDPARVAGLLEGDATPETESLQAAAARAAGLWNVASARPRLEALARAESSTPQVQQGALEGISAFGDEASLSVLMEISGPGHPTPVRLLASAALIPVDASRAAGRAIEALAEIQPGKATEPGVTGVFQAFLQRTAGPGALTQALADHKLPPDVAKIGLRLTSASGRAEPELSKALSIAGGLNETPPELTPEQMQQKVEAVKTRGDAARGEAIYRGATGNCLKCHAIGGSGGKVGPDMTSLGASAQIDYLIDSLMKPSKAIKEGYNTLNVTTKDGNVLSGVRVRQNDTELVLRDGEDQEVVIPAASIKEQSDGLSLMPEGLPDALTEEEFLDLVRFLSELGKEGPFALGKERLARTWRALQPTENAPRRLLEAGFIVVTKDDPALMWSPVYSRVSGELPMDELPVVKQTPDSPGAAFIQFGVEVSTGGKIGLRVNSIAGLAAWVDQTPLEPAAEMVVDLAQGTHTVTFAINPAQRSEALRCELTDVPGSPAQALVIGGK